MESVTHVVGLFCYPCRRLDTLAGGGWGEGAGEYRGIDKPRLQLLRTLHPPCDPQHGPVSSGDLDHRFHPDQALCQPAHLVGELVHFPGQRLHPLVDQDDRFDGSDGLPVQNSRTRTPIRLEQPVFRQACVPPRPTGATFPPVSLPSGPAECATRKPRRRRLRHRPQRPSAPARLPRFCQPDALSLRALPFLAATSAPPFVRSQPTAILQYMIMHMCILAMPCQANSSARHPTPIPSPHLRNPHRFSSRASVPPSTAARCGGGRASASTASTGILHCIENG